MNESWMQKEISTVGIVTGKIHTLKIKHEYWTDVYNGMKSFEVRFNDREYQKGDLIQFTVLKDDGSIFMQPVTQYIITYILDYPDALKEGYVVLAIRPYKR